MQRQIVAKDAEDIGVVFTVHGRKFTAKAPHGVLDPQPDPVLADMMAQMSCFRWQGFNGDTVLRRADTPPSLEEIRQRLAGASNDFGEVQVDPSAPVGLRRIATKEVAAPVADDFDLTPAPSIASFSELREAAEKRAAAQAEAKAAEELAAHGDELDLFDEKAPEVEAPVVSAASEEEAEKLDVLAQLGEDTAALLRAENSLQLPPPPNPLLRKKQR